MMEGDLLRIFAIYLLVETNRVADPVECSFVLSKVLFQYLLASRPTLSVSSAHQEWSQLAKLFEDDNIKAFFVDQVKEYCASFSLFSDFLDRNLKHVFDEAAANATGLKGPSRISESSFLGVCVRSVLARWQSYEFDQQCRCYSDFTSFINSISEDQPVSLLLNASVNRFEEYCAQGKMVEAEAWIHKYFDNRSLHFLFITNPSSKTDSKDLAELALSLENAFASDREKRVDQRTMLAFAVLRIRANDMINAQLAVDEALKIAHQSADHASVAYCLLLLFHITERSNHLHSSNSSNTQSEDLLRRCILRAATLKLPHLVAEAGLSYATVKLREAASIDSSHENQANDNLATSSSWSFDRIHRFLALCEFGDSQRIAKALVSDEDFSSAHDVSSGMGGGMMMMRGPSSMMSSTSSNDGSCLDPSAEGYVSFSMKIAIVAAQVLCQQQEYEMAVLCCTRAMERYSSASDIDMQYLIALHLVQLEINAFVRQNVNCNRDEALLYLIAQLTQYKQQVTTKTLQDSIYAKQVLDTIIAYLAALCAALKGEWSRSLRFMDHCVAWSTSFASNHSHMMPVILQITSLRLLLLQALIKGKVESLDEVKILSQFSLLARDAGYSSRCLEEAPLVQWLVKL